MKKTIQIFMIISICMMAFNVYQIDWQTPLEGKSTVAVIGGLASGSAFLLLLILQLARKIKQKSEG